MSITRCPWLLPLIPISIYLCIHRRPADCHWPTATRRWALPQTHRELTRGPLTLKKPSQQTSSSPRPPTPRRRSHHPHSHQSHSKGPRLPPSRGASPSIQAHPSMQHVHCRPRPKHAAPRRRRRRRRLLRRCCCCCCCLCIQQRHAPRAARRRAGRLTSYARYRGDGRLSVTYRTWQ